MVTSDTTNGSTADEPVALPSAPTIRETLEETFSQLADLGRDSGAKLGNRTLDLVEANLQRLIEAERKLGESVRVPGLERALTAQESLSTHGTRWVRQLVN